MGALVKKSARRESRPERHDSLFLPVPNHPFSPDSQSEVDSEGAVGASEANLAKRLDKESSIFYGALCALYEKANIHPAVALHSLEIFIQSLKRSERARLGVENPETAE